MSLQAAATSCLFQLWLLLPAFDGPLIAICGSLQWKLPCVFEPFFMLSRTVDPPKFAV